MKKIILVFLSLLIFTGCAVKSPIKNQYRLECFSKKHITTNAKTSIVLTQPEAVSGYQTQRMLYIKEPFSLNAFQNNSWVGAPANMLYPLMLQSLRSTGFFYAVTSTPYADKTDYRLDTQLLSLHQNFLTHPSTLELSVNLVISHVPTNKILASKIIKAKINCPYDSPYGGVIAANEATGIFTASLVEFVISNISKDLNHIKQS